MHIKNLVECPEFVAGDQALLREILNPRKEELQIHYSLAWARVKPGETTLPHRLAASEVYYILAGSGKMKINDTSRDVRKNDTIYIPPLARQCIENTGSGCLEFLCIVDPAWQRDQEQVFE